MDLYKLNGIKQLGESKVPLALWLDQAVILRHHDHRVPELQDYIAKVHAKRANGALDAAEPLASSPAALTVIEGGASPASPAPKLYGFDAAVEEVLDIGAAMAEALAKDRRDIVGKQFRLQNSLANLRRHLGEVGTTPRLGDTLGSRSGRLGPMIGNCAQDLEAFARLVATLKQQRDPANRSYQAVSYQSAYDALEATLLRVLHAIRGISGGSGHGSAE